MEKRDGLVRALVAVVALVALSLVLVVALVVVAPMMLDANEGIQEVESTLASRDFSFEISAYDQGRKSREQLLATGVTKKDVEEWCSWATPIGKMKEVCKR